MSDPESRDPLEEYRNRVQGNVPTRPTDRPASKEALLKQVDSLRDLARRAKRLVDTATDEGDRHRLERFAEELEESASRLERSAMDAKSG